MFMRGIAEIRETFTESKIGNRVQNLARCARKTENKHSTQTAIGFSFFLFFLSCSIFLSGGSAFFFFFLNPLSRIPSNHSAPVQCVIAHGIKIAGR